MAMLGINGFGRMGRMITRLAMKNKIDILAINAPEMAPPYIAYLLQRDLPNDKLSGCVIAEKDRILVNGIPIKIFNENNPSQIPWQETCVNYVIEATGEADTKEEASAHIRGNVKKVIYAGSSPDIPTFIPGVNLQKYKKDMNVLSSGCCSTNCIAPLVKIMHSNFCLQNASISIVQALGCAHKMDDQCSQEGWRIGRGPSNLIPASTPAVSEILQFMPEMKDKIGASAIRVPVTDACVANVTCMIKRPADIQKIEQAFSECSKGLYKGIVGVAEIASVSSDFASDTRSVIVDIDSCQVITPNIVKIVAWYNTEYGYASRVIDLVNHIHNIEKGVEYKVEEESDPCGDRPDPPKECVPDNKKEGCPPNCPKKDPTAPPEECKEDVPPPPPPPLTCAQKAEKKANDPSKCPPPAMPEGDCAPKKKDAGKKKKNIFCNGKKEEKKGEEKPSNGKKEEKKEEKPCNGKIEAKKEEKPSNGKKEEKKEDKPCNGKKEEKKEEKPCNGKDK